MSYRDLPDDEQVEVLRPVASRAARAFGLDVRAMELASHAYNTTFRVDTADGDRFALRVGTNSHSTGANVVAHQCWQRALATETDVLVAEPLRSADGGWYVEVEAELLERPAIVTAATWLAGPDIEEPDVTVARELGRVMARLHRHAEGWELPADGSLPRFDSPLFGDEDLLDTAPGLTPADRSVLDRARAATSDAFTALDRSPTPERPLHADLHSGNLKWQGSRLAVLDFDDSGLGRPPLDLAIAMFYLRGDDATLEEALVAGYADVAPLPEVDPADFEALVAARQLLLANDLLTSSTTELRRQAGRYTRVTLDRLRHWLDTGTFTRAVPNGGTT